MTGWPELDGFLHTDPRDVGCEQAMEILHAYAGLVLGDASGDASHRHPGVAAHLLACGPCADDVQGLLIAAGSDRS
jgi:hypothetical protein